MKKYDWKDDYVDEDGKLEDGWYYVKLWKDMKKEFGVDPDGDINARPYLFLREMEENLPPTRCIYIKDKRWESETYDYRISPDMIDSPVYTVGKEYEFSYYGEIWVKYTYVGYQYVKSGKHIAKNKDDHLYTFPYCREISTLKLSMNDKEVELTTEQIKLIKGIIK